MHQYLKASIGWLARCGIGCWIFYAKLSGLPWEKTANPGSLEGRIFQDGPREPQREVGGTQEARWDRGPEFLGVAALSLNHRLDRMNPHGKKDGLPLRLHQPPGCSFDLLPSRLCPDCATCPEGSSSSSPLSASFRTQLQTHLIPLNTGAFPLRSSPFLKVETLHVS